MTHIIGSSRNRIIDINKLFLTPEQIEEEKRKILAEMQEEKVEQQQNKTTSSRIYEGLGIDYGLVFNSNNKVYTTDGKKVTKLGFNALDLFYDHEDESLYRTQDYVFIKYADEDRVFLEKPYQITKFKGKFLVSFSSSGKIKDLEGNDIYSDLDTPINMREFKGELYHTEGYNGRGLVRTRDELSIAETGDWTQALECFLDKLYFGGDDKRLYSYDGNRLNIHRNLDLELLCLHGVKEKNKNILYAGGLNFPAIGLMELSDKGEFIKENDILINQVQDVSSIVSVPLEFMERLNNDSKIYSGIRNFQ